MTNIDSSGQQRAIPTAPFDHRSDPELLRSPWERVGQLRDQHPISATPLGERHIWYVAGYDQVRDADQRPDLFSSTTLNVYGPENEPDRRIIPAEIDPPEHGAYRQMVLGHLSPGAIRAMEPRVRDRAAELVDALVGRGGCEFISDFSKKFPTQIFMMLMGLPIDQAEYMVDLSDAYLHAGDDETSQQRAMAAYDEIEQFLYGLIAERRANPRDDLLTHLTECDVSGRPITDVEVKNYSVTLYLGGLDTVAMQLGHMLAFLAQHDDYRAQILGEPELIPSAVEEMLRYFPILTSGRVVTQDVEFHGCPMRKGDRMLVATVGAGRDGNEFDAADEVDFRRTPNRHLSFGAGPHRCVGSHLARAELVIGLEEWHRRIPHYSIEGGPLHYHGGAIIGLDRLDLVWATP